MGPMLFLCAFLIINFSRYINIYSISELLNYYRKKNKITPTFKFIIWFSGFRGAMGYN